ncbi:MAG TPA: hypothetical protein VFZ85_11595 [Jiangellaceae bacterium]
MDQSTATKPPAAGAGAPIAELGLLVAAAANVSAVVLFTLHDGANGGLPPSHGYLVVERSLFMVGMLLSAIAFCLLDDRGAGRANPLLRAGALGYLAASIVGVVGESIDLESSEIYSLFVTYVLAAFVSQTVIGLGLRAARLVAPWVAWTTVAWNVACPVVLRLASPDDLYFPVLHLLMPLLIGVHMLLRRDVDAQTSS